MKKNSYSDFRSFRARILSREKNQVRVSSEALLSIALVFPNSYAVGMANLGFQTIYRLFNLLPGVRCERAFRYEQFPGVTQTIESGEQLRNFDIVAFSVAYELDFPNLVQILTNAGITSLSEKRHPFEPLVIAGGATAFMNPVPVALFVDLFFIGEIEPQLNNIFPVLIQLKQERWNRSEILEKLHDEVGIYVPRFQNRNKKIKKIYQPSPQTTPQYSPVVCPDSHFKNMLLIEAGRGCGRHCHFCAASHIYHPFRIFSKEKILNVIQTYSDNTKKIGLIGAALSDYPRLHHLCRELVDRGYELGLSSFRLDAISADFLDILEMGKVKTLTFAPEAGTERLRHVIHKNLPDKIILEAVQAIAESQINQVKLYFMIGLPGERDDDIAGIVDLVKTIQRTLIKNRKMRSITVSTNAFIPKPFTPFQWSAMDAIAEIRRKRRYLAKELKNISGIHLIRKSAKQEVLQGMFSLGDQKIANAIYFKVKNNVDWQAAWEKFGINVDSILYQSRRIEDALPWDFMEYSIPKERLWAAWQKALKNAS